MHHTAPRPAANSVVIPIAVVRKYSPRNFTLYSVYLYLCLSPFGWYLEATFGGLPYSIPSRLFDQFPLHMPVPSLPMGLVVSTHLHCQLYLV